MATILSPKLSCRLERGVFEALQAYLEDEPDATASSVVNAALRDYLEQYSEDPAPRAAEANRQLDTRISNMPDEWARPAVEVLDTVDCVGIALRSFGIPGDSLLVADLTRMILERHDRP